MNNATNINEPITVKINTDRRVYVLEAGGGFTCLGFDVAYDRALNVAQWLDSEGQTAEQPNPALKGTAAGYKQYRRIMDAGFVYNRTTGKRCDSELAKQLIGKEGSRVEVVDQDGQTRRFWVGKSAGWMPCHLEIAKSNVSGGSTVYGAPFKSVIVVDNRTT